MNNNFTKENNNKKGGNDMNANIETGKAYKELKEFGLFGLMPNGFNVYLDDEDMVKSDDSYYAHLEYNLDDGVYKTPNGIIVTSEELKESKVTFIGSDPMGEFVVPALWIKPNDAWYEKQKRMMNNNTERKDAMYMITTTLPENSFSITVQVNNPEELVGKTYEEIAKKFADMVVRNAIHVDGPFVTEPGKFYDINKNGIVKDVDIDNIDGIHVRLDTPFVETKNPTLDSIMGVKGPEED
jgi:hypothetical protein